MNQKRDTKLQPEKLTPAEIERLRQNLREANAYFQKVFTAESSKGALTCRKRHGVQKKGEP